MITKYIEVVTRKKAGTILLNRPEVRNALNPQMIEELINAVTTLQSDPGMQMIIIRGKNGTFSSGADLKWMRDSGTKTVEENLAESRLISDLMETLHQVQIPLISVTEGMVAGGALGILGCCDWVLAEADTMFAFSEVNLGLAPAIIMPYILRRSKSLIIKQMMLTGDHFDSWKAHEAGLVDRIGPLTDIENELTRLGKIFANLPGEAVREIKRLWYLSQPVIGNEISEMNIHTLSTLKQSVPAQELLHRFLNRR